MRRSIATVSLSGSLADKLTAAGAAGFDGVEIFENDLVAGDLTPEDVRRRAADLGLGIDLYQPFRDFEAVPPGVLAGGLRRAEHKFALMERLGATMMLVCSNVSPAAVDDDGLAAEQLKLLAERAAEHGIRIAYEALAWGRHVSDYLHAWRIVREADHPNLGVCLDSFHILARDTGPYAIETIPGEKIFFLQLADAPALPMDVLYWSRHYRCFPGQGDLDVAGLVASVLRTGYAGPLSLEVFNDIFRQAAAMRTAQDALRSLIALEEQVGERLGGASRPAALAPPPRPVVPSGFAFAELAVPDAGPLPRLLDGLGFTRTGTHAGKPVDLWEQGRARILLNRGSAESQDGPALGAIGLESPDPAASVKRAEALLSPVLPRLRGPHDAPLDAVAAPDGTELFFCRTRHPDHTSWTDDFTTGRRASEDAGGEITHIDHVALTQPWHHFDEASLFYRSVLGLRPHDSLELPDPYGLLRSRAVSSEDGGVRVALNVAYVGAHGGRPDAAWQHVALASRDIVAGARRLRAAGLSPLAIPENYYDDLEARHDLGTERHELLRELGLLYDRDEYGEFLHFYTATTGRVFFEIVQRIGDYRGYGAINAPVRLAAQHTRAQRVPPP
ncbi:sugar phosphate isomerase/epimerase and 4-hydroxyphenylpyruvate domain-containing protein [Actinomadura darangshiensis]|uniref:3-dehydroshikimate dehydratase n=1 Tax=Actinomadura darangshiensis TaxID=705336 RepID=A0A4R5BDK3_9ACTN|nr:sugar phosphate isomerase/epimerase and 4-hydroxyphenylpyruvate domain-containing protein [Actinomadura darangshiensis]TDD84291.1 sugar phosphate isomerase/epimerase and 4-hydroxyphenylpyruvate domain-containing protein [Actinomadura darangshiensis]